MTNGYSPELLDIVRPFWEQSELSGTFDQWMKEWGMYFDDYDPYQEDVKRQQFAFSKESLRDPYEADIRSASQKLGRGGIRGGYMHEDILGENPLQDRINSMTLSTQSAIKSLEDAWRERIYNMVGDVTQMGAYEKVETESRDEYESGWDVAWDLAGDWWDEEGPGSWW